MEKPGSSPSSPQKSVVEVTSWLSQLEIDNENAKTALIKAGYSTLGRLKAVPPTAQDLNNYGFNDFERNLILKNLITPTTDQTTPTITTTTTTTTTSTTPTTSDSPSPTTTKRPKLDIGSLTDNKPSPTEEPKPKTKKIVWLWEESSNWQAYDVLTQEQIEKAHFNGEKNVRLNRGFFKNKDYVVEFSSMTQTNEETGFERKIKRIETDSAEYPDINDQFEKLCAAAWTSDETTFHKYVLSYSLDDLKKKKNSRKQTLMYCAARGGSYYIVRRLIEMKCSPIGPQAPKKSTPLHGAAWGAHSSVVAFLILNGAEVRATNSLGYTPQQESKGDAKEVFEAFTNKGKDAITKYLPREHIKIKITIHKLTGVPIQKYEGSGNLVETIITLLDQEKKLAVWQSEQHADSNMRCDLEFSGYFMGVSSEIYMNIMFYQTGGEGAPVTLGNFSMPISCIKRSTINKDYEIKTSVYADGDMSVTHDEDYTEHEFLMNKTVQVENLNSESIKKLYSKKVSSTSGFSEEQLSEFYKKLYYLQASSWSTMSNNLEVPGLLEKKSSGLSLDRIRKLAKSLPGKRRSRILKDNGDLYVDEDRENGVLAPTILLSSCKTQYNTMSLNEKLEVLLGIELACESLYQLYLEACNIKHENKTNVWTWRNFVDEHILTLDFTVFCEDLKKLSTDKRDVKSLCKIICKNIRKTVLQD
eukprot:TRINITY_DN297_c1_g1_i1.p1 TRINITY_DN297_c1_g1~~TRINITY_DN297_c1_g1_i1.p1  ORF type:complete len:698 (-),score=160.31 TRINITY_DN297_c1_g1_i1:87-2180(-)